MRAGLAVFALLLAWFPASAAACESRAVGLPQHGRLVCGVQLPADDDALVSWDGVLKRSPDRGWRRYGTQKLIDTIELIAIDYGRRFPIGPRLVVGDLSRKGGGDIDGHASHENGLDADIYYPRKDGLEAGPDSIQQVDRRRAQWLVDRAARLPDAQFVFIGPHVGLRRPRPFVEYLVNHDNHLHLRIRR